MIGNSIWLVTLEPATMIQLVPMPTAEVLVCTSNCQPMGISHANGDNIRRDGTSEGVGFICCQRHLKWHSEKFNLRIAAIAILRGWVGEIKFHCRDVCCQGASHGRQCYPCGRLRVGRIYWIIIYTAQQEECRWCRHGGIINRVSLLIAPRIRPSTINCDVGKIVSICGAGEGIDYRGARVPPPLPHVT